MRQFRYGDGATFCLEMSPESFVADAARDGGALSEDAATAVENALADPAGYPPLVDAVVPGDRVTVSMEPVVPEAARIAAGTIRTLCSAGIAAADVTILTSGMPSIQDELVSLLSPEAVGVQFVHHDPDDRGNLSYLAASRDAEPIYLNRHLCEADVVVPISLLRPRSSLGYHGIHRGLIPTFSDAATIQRFRAPQAARPGSEQLKREQEANEVAWLLGAQLTVQIVPGPNDSILHIVAGLVEEVTKRGHELLEASWSYSMPAASNLVIATIEGGPAAQTWEEFGRALFTASRVCGEDGTIILCTELAGKLGPALRRLTRHEDTDRLLRRVRRDRSPDAISATLLLEARDRQHVYLLSRMDASLVESIGLGYVEGPDQVARLSQQYDSCILLANAHRIAFGSARH